MKNQTAVITVKSLWLTLAACLLGLSPATAITYTWDITPGTIGIGNGVINDGSGTWDTLNGHWSSDGGANGVAWPDTTTDIAEFNGVSGGVVTVSGNFSAGGLLFSGAGTNSYTFTGDGVPTLTLGSGGFTFSASAGHSVMNTILSGNNAITLNGGGTLTLGAQNTVTGVNNIGNTTAGNTLNITGRLTSGTAYSFNVGRDGFGNNIVDVSGPGNSGLPTVLLSGNSSSFWIGGEGSPSSNNHLTIRNGAYFRAAGGNGTTNSKMGANAGSTHNSITVTGTGSTLSHSGHQIYIGELGSYNTLTVSAGGQFFARVFNVGAGGHDNAVSSTGNGSYVRVTEDMRIGGGNNASNNSVTVVNAGNLYSRTRNGRTEISCNIGGANGANNNSLTITGSGSTWTNEGFHVVIGGAGAPATPLSQNAINNTLNVYDGATAFIYTGVTLSGIQSSFNLGNGTGIGSATVGSTRDGGVLLSAPDSKMNFNNGRLIAATNGVTLVSGSGIISNTGPATISTAFTNTIASTISGPGELNKEGSGVLVLSGTNTYIGATIVAEGTLQLTNPDCLSEDTEAWIATGAQIDLAFSGINTIDGLYIDGVQQSAGLYGQSRLPSYLRGTGFLRVLTGKVTNNILFVIR